MNEIASHVKLFLAIVGIICSVIIYAFTTFATKEEIKGSVIQRLDRIETKVDRVLESR